MIVAPQPEATEAGAEILTAGGKAVEGGHRLRLTPKGADWQQAVPTSG